MRKVTRALALVATLPLALSLSVLSPQVALADIAPPPPPMVIEDGTEIALPLEEATGTCAAADPETGFFATPACAGLAVATLAVLTAPVWMPMVDNAVGGVMKFFGIDGVQTQCSVTMGAFSDYVNSYGGHGVTLSVDTQGCSPSSITVYLWMRNVECYNTFTHATTIAYSTPGSYASINTWGLNQGTQTVSFSPCGENALNVENVDLKWTKPQNQAPLDPAAPQTPWDTYVNITDPTRYTTTTEVQCRKMADGSVSNISQSYTGSTSGWVLPSCKAAVDPSAIPEHVVVKGGPEGGIQHVLSTIDTKPDYQTKYPNCFGPSGLLCNIHVNIDGHPCTVGDTDCENWWELNRTQPSRVNCKFGGYNISMTNCVLLRYAYRPNTVQTVDTTDGQGNPTTNPGTNGSTGTSTGTTTIPQTGTNDTVPAPITSGTNPESSDCWSHGWSWNPVSWVYVPVKCALTWAFVPTEAPSFSDIPSPLPAGWVPSLPSLGDGSCGAVSMPPLSFGMGVHTGTTTMFNTCAAPWPTVRSLTYYGLLAGGLVGIGYRGFRAVMKALGMEVDTPAGGGDDE